MTEEFEFFDEKPENIKDFLIKEFEEDNFEKTGLQTEKYCICVKRKDEIIGATKGGIFDGALYISEFAIKKSYRKSGLGSKLIERIEKYAKDKNCKKIWVDTYEYQAPEFYKKNGFLEQGRIENYRGKYAKIFFEKEI
jgi:ribosomal protein S18 acetylase RimI-like enzyme